MVHLSDGRPFIFFLDFKSREELKYGISKPNKIIAKQYKSLCEAVASITVDDLKSDNGLLKCLHEGRFAFVYCTTYDNVEVRVCDDHPVSTKGSLVVLNRDAMMNYLGPVFDIYATIRSMTDTKTSRQTPQYQ
jgi:hypothetical protein